MTKLRAGLVILDDRLTAIYAIAALGILRDKFGADYVNAAIDEAEKVFDSQSDVVEATSKHTLSKLSPFGKMMLDIQEEKND